MLDMKLLHVLPTLDQTDGGPVRLVIDLSARAMSLGLHSEVLGLGPVNLSDNPLPSHLVHSLPVTRPSSYRYSPALKDWLEKHLPRFQAVVLHGSWTYPECLAARLAHTAGIPYGIFPHGMLEPWAVHGQGFLKSVKKRVYWWWRESEVVRDAKCVFFTTRMEQELANSILPFPPNQRVLPPYGVSSRCEVIEQPSNAALLKFRGRPFALFLSRIHPKKNLNFLLRAWKLATPPDPWHLVVAGTGSPDYLRQLNALVLELGLHEKVSFVGFAAGDDKKWLLQEASWFMLPSKQENFGIAVLEAVSQRCAVAISDRVYLCESFRPGSEVLPLQLDNWVDFIRNRMTDPDHRARTASADVEHLALSFSMNVVTQRWADTLRTALVT